jgi:hypothetical protein
MFVRISETPNIPMITATRSNPPAMLTDPKVKRSTPLTTSMPTVETQMPAVIIMKALSIEPPTMKIVTTKPRTISEKYSGGPNLRAATTRMGENTFRPMVLRVPATNEANAAMPSAAPARPCLAIW